MKAQVLNADRAPADLRVVSDTRTIKPGDTFLALCGERFDGHAFIGEALAKGAAALIVDEAGAAPVDATMLVVENTLRAYMTLARAARERFRGRVLAITGSAGKTTTKVFSSQLLATRYGNRVLASPANENNEIGVAKLLLAATNEAHDVLVVEMGARHYGDIAVLTAMAKPDVSILTNVGDAHLEIMGSRERLEDTKWSVFENVPWAILNASDEASQRRASSLERVPHWFYAGAHDDRIPDYPSVTALLGRGRFVNVRDRAVHECDVDVRVPGRHNRANLAAAAAGALELDADFAALARALEGVSLPKGRYEAIEAGNIRLIYDAYNANAAGMMAALDAFSEEPAGRRIALLSSMAELGTESRELHRRVGAHAATSNIDVALFGGDFADELAHGARSAGFSSERIVCFATNEQAAAWIRANAREGDAVLLKGSRKYTLEDIVEELRT
jgi:UDP-N-acetylmuramoyl-tripeptide--D-alanyl-D-alanine ligase